MNKKGELILLSVSMLIVLIIGIVVYQQNTENKNYIGDTTTKIVYNMKSDNKNCSVDSIKISKDNFKLFKTFDEALQEGYSLDNNCN